LQPASSFQSPFLIDEKWHLGNMQLRFVLALILCAAAQPAMAAPVEQVDCAFNAMKPLEQLQLGKITMANMSSDKNALPSKAAVVAVSETLGNAIFTCAGGFGWNENDASNALAYTTVRGMLLETQGIVQKLGGTVNAADLFYAQNKYKILEEEAASRSSEVWANEALLQMGFAPMGSPAFDAVWLYLGLLFQQDDMRAAFIDGKKLSM
jgi:hypothetical protein